MKLLLTAGGFTNASIRDALVDLLGKPIEEASALYIPTAIYANSRGASLSTMVIRGEIGAPFCNAGWKSLGLLELTALPTLDRERWVTWVREADALLVGGGDPLYLSYWMRESGLVELLPSLRPEMVYVGLSAGSMVLAPRVGQFFVDWTPPTGGDETLGLIDFSIFPHLDHPMLPHNTMANAERWAADIAGPAYAIDDDTAIKIDGGTVEIISEGNWKQLNP